MWYNWVMESKKEQRTSGEEMVTISRAEYEEYQGQNERISALEQQVELLTEAIRLSRQKRFGTSSEHTSEEAMDQLSLLFNEAEVCGDQAAKEENDSVAVAAHKRHKTHEYTLDELPENVPVEVVEHRLPAEELVCPACGDTMTEIGKAVRRRLQLAPANVIVVEDGYYPYACRKCEKEDTETAVVKAPREPNFIPGSFAMPEAAAHLMVQKFVMGIPLSRQTMSNWLLGSCQ